VTRIANNLSAEELGTKKVRPNAYTEADDKVIHEMYYNAPLTTIANLLGRTPNAIKLRAHYLGITRRRGHNVKAGNGKPSRMEDLPDAEPTEVLPTPEQVVSRMVGSRLWATSEEIKAYEAAAVARAHEILGGADA
jgi:hypothetical protein